MRHSRLTAMLLAGAILLALASSASSAMIYVKWDSPGPTFDGASWGTAFHTVQAGLNAASSGGEVWVARGTYSESITLKNGVALYGGFAGSETERAQRNWSANVAILGGSGGGSVVTSVTSTARIDGFTIRNGGSGSGLWCYNSVLTIANNTISGNSGGGIYCYSCSGAISNNTITGNGDLGIYCDTSPLTIANNTVSLNNDTGISCYQSSPTISCNTILGNTGSSGGGICCNASSAVIFDNAITGNSASYGGGIYCYSVNPTIVNNTITGNSASSGGGGLFTDHSSATIANNIFAFNSSGVYGSGGTPTLRNNCVYNPGASNYSGILPGTGDISQDPLFVNRVGGDLHLTGSSPCINAGWNSAPNLPTTDFAGNPRIVNGTVDIGMYEYTYPVVARPSFSPDGGVYESDQVVTVTCDTPDAVIRYTLNGVDPTASDPVVANGGTIPVSVNPAMTLKARAWKAGYEESAVASAVYRLPTVFHVKPGGNDMNDGLTWATAKATTQAGIDAAHASTKGHVWVAAGTYIERITVKNGVSLYGGYAGVGSTRDTEAYLSILDGSAGGSVVVSPSGATGNRIDGFTIRNGSAYTGGGVYCNASSTVITNNKITGNLATYGGGICCGAGSSAVISNNTITGNEAPAGGGVYGWSSSLTLSSNVIRDNDAEFGGGINLYSASGQIAGNTIAGNSASWDGGGVCFTENSLAAIIGNTITDNTASYGGGISCSASSPAITNNTITGNTASTGGGVYCSSSSPAISNAIISFNSSGIYGSGGTPTLRNNCVHNPSGSNYSGVVAGTGDISQDPLLVNRAAGDLHLTGSSPCIDAGWNGAASLPATDLAGNPRIVNGTVDIGAYEYTRPVVAKPVFSPDGGVYESDQVVTVTCDTPGAVIHYTTNGADPTEADPILASGGTITVIVNPATTLKARAWKTDFDQSLIASADYRLPVIFRVTTNGSDANDGLTWETAKRTVQAGIDAAQTAGGGQVWVASGTYKPTYGGDRNVSFVLSLGVAAYGGFAGSETMRSQRNWVNNPTILSGDIGAAGNVSDNSYHVVVGANDAELDGFTVTGGNANGSADLDKNGGGMWNQLCSPTVRNCVFSGNSAEWNGGGLYLNDSSGAGAIARCTFSDNWAYYGGGVMTEGGSTIIISQCDLLRNRSQSNGAGMHNYSSSPSVEHCSFRGNVAGSSDSGSFGGGVYCSWGSARLRGCTFVGNRSGYGAGMQMMGGTPGIVNCTFAANNANYYGGAVHLDQSASATVANSIMWYNTALSGSQIYVQSGSSATATYCDVQGGWTGIGNINVNPMFVRDPQPGTDGVWGTSDDDYGDLHLQASSPCIDVGTNLAPGIASTDMDGQARIYGGTVDIGADEYAPTPEIVTICEAKTSANGSLVWVGGAVISAAWEDFFYISADDRSGGIRVEQVAHELVEGERADVTGTMRTNSHGERYVEAHFATQSGSGSVKPIGMAGNRIGGSDWFYDPVAGAGQCGVLGGYGVNNIGLLVRAWGKVTQIGSDYLYIDDGSGLRDGTTTGAEENVGVRAICDPMGYASGEKVAVTAISSCFWTPSGVARRILTRHPSDIRRLATP